MLKPRVLTRRPRGWRLRIHCLGAVRAKLLRPAAVIGSPALRFGRRDRALGGPRRLLRVPGRRTVLRQAMFRVTTNEVVRVLGPPAPPGLGHARASHSRHARSPPASSTPATPRDRSTPRAAVAADPDGRAGCSPRRTAPRANDARAHRCRTCPRAAARGSRWRSGHGCRPQAGALTVKLTAADGSDAIRLASGRRSTSLPRVGPPRPGRIRLRRRRLRRHEVASVEEIAERVLRIIERRARAQRERLGNV